MIRVRRRRDRDRTQGAPVGGCHLADDLIFGRMPKELVVEHEDTRVRFGRDTTEVGARRVGAGVVGPPLRCAGREAGRGVHLINEHVTIGVRTRHARERTGVAGDHHNSVWRGDAVAHGRERPVKVRVPLSVVHLERFDLDEVIRVDSVR